MAFVLVVVMSSVLTVLAIHLSTASTEPALIAMQTRPIQFAFAQGIVLLMFAGLIQGVGRMAGGTGNFPDALLLLVWVQVILLLLQVAQIVLQLVLPPAAELLGLMGLVLMLWLVTNFVAELHGFSSLGAVFAAVVGTVLGLGFALAVVFLILFGV